MHLSVDLYKECYDTLLQCDECCSYESLQAIFVTSELSMYQHRLPRANNPESLVSQTIAYLVRQHLDDGRSVFPIFLEMLWDRRLPGDALRDALGKLQAQAEQELQEVDEIGAIDIPFVIVAMTHDQADALMKGKLDHSVVTPVELTRCEKFRKMLDGHGISIADIPDSYGKAREEWRPPTAQKSTIYTIVWGIFNRINATRPAGSPQIRPRFRSSEFFDENKNTRVKAWDELGQSGCVVIIDAVSMFHPKLCHDLLSSRIDSSKQVAILVFSPVNPSDIPVNAAIEQEIRERMELAFEKFSNLEKRYEFSAGNLLTLQRWLFLILPEVIETVQRGRPSLSSLELMQEVMGPQLGVEDLLFRR